MCVGPEPETMEDDFEEVVHRQLDTETESPAVEIAEYVAELEGKDATDLTTIYGRVGDVLDNIFSEPPAPDAQLEVAFTYESYRITVRQDGTATFARLG